MFHPIGNVELLFGMAHHESSELSERGFGSLANQVSLITVS